LFINNSSSPAGRFLLYGASWHAKRKEVTGMRYEKPTVVLAASAVDAVQGTGKIDDPMDSSQPTNAAYQADE